MAARRAVFIDFDGTLAEQGVVPSAHVEAISRARANGHAVLLCTGRAASIVSSAIAGLLDGVVASAGAHVRIGDRLLRDERFPAALARRAVEVLEAQQVTYALEAPEALFCPPRAMARFTAQLEELDRAAPGGVGRGAQDIIDAVEFPEDLRACSFAKISLWASPVRVEQLAHEIGPEVGALPNSIVDDVRSGELHLRTIDKADGVGLVAEHLGLGMGSTVGIGDGMNDLGMLRATGTSVVVEDAPAVLREEADLEIPGPAGHGIAVAFERLGLI